MADTAAKETNGIFKKDGLADAETSSNGSGSDIAESSPPAPKNEVRQSLQDRSRVPPSMYMLAFLFVVFEYYGGVVINFSEVAASWWDSMVTSYTTAWRSMEYLRDLLQSVAAGKDVDTMECVYAGIITLVVGSILYVLIWSPLRAGMWTGQRARRHVLHRFMGLFYLLQYFAAWIEFTTNYENSKNSYLPHFISICGLVQGVSAYFSFRVLPDVVDPGYYSDRAVLSRVFVHENLYFSLLSYVGSTMYNDVLRNNIQSNLFSSALQYIFVFWPYIMIRPWYPRTHFSLAGVARAGRSEQNEMFYTVGTMMVKFFYMWAKYYIAFYINHLIFLGSYTDEDIRFIRGMFILNVGTVSIAVFLHTLRFKKVLPPKFTFSIYLAQIYATFSAIPYAYNMFAQHKKLCALMFLGILFNLTRNLKLHAVWCGLCMYLEMFSDVEF